MSGPASGLDVEVIGAERLGGGRAPAQIEMLCRAALRAVGIADGHIAIELVDADRIAELNARHRSKPQPTDVLSFPIDERDSQPGVERELGDVVICPEHTRDISEAIVHGVLHLLGMDHETDDGEMLALQAQILAGCSKAPLPEASR